VDPERDLDAFEAWLTIDSEVARLACLAREKMGAVAANQLERLRGTLAAEAQMYQDGAFEARMRDEREAEVPNRPDKFTGQTTVCKLLI